MVQIFLTFFSVLFGIETHENFEFKQISNDGGYFIECSKEQDKSCNLVDSKTNNIMEDIKFKEPFTISKNNELFAFQSTNSSLNVFKVDLKNLKQSYFPFEQEEIPKGIFDNIIEGKIAIVFKRDILVISDELEYINLISLDESEIEKVIIHSDNVLLKLKSGDIYFLGKEYGRSGEDFDYGIALNKIDETEMIKLANSLFELPFATLGNDDILSLLDNKFFLSNSIVKEIKISPGKNSLDGYFEEISIDQIKELQLLQGENKILALSKGDLFINGMLIDDRLLFEKVKLKGVKEIESILDVKILKHGEGMDIILVVKEKTGEIKVLKNRAQEEYTLEERIDFIDKDYEIDVLNHIPAFHIPVFVDKFFGFGIVFDIEQQTAVSNFFKKELFKSVTLFRHTKLEGKNAAIYLVKGFDGKKYLFIKSDLQKDKISGEDLFVCYAIELGSKDIKKSLALFLNFLSKNK